METNEEQVEMQTQGKKRKRATNRMVKESKTVRPRTRWIYLQDFQISSELIDIIYNAETKTINKIMYKRYKNRIAKNHIDPIVGCIALVKEFYIGSKKIYNGSEDLCFRIYCQHPTCQRKFMAKCKLKDVSTGLFKLYRSDNEQTHKHFLTRQVRQADRACTTETLKTKMPMELRRENIEQATDDMLENQNLQEVKSDAVYNKMRHEALQSNDLHKDDIRDLELMMDEEDQFIQKVSTKPFSVNIYSKSQCGVISKKQKDSPDKERVGHLDATGGVVRHPYENIYENVKQIYYYACIMNLKVNSDVLGTLIPIFELISDCQEAVFLGGWISAFKLYFRAQHPHIRTPFHRIVVDKSYALIHAVLEGFNDMSLQEYLEMSYDIVSGNKSVESPEFKKITKLHSCFTHASKVFSKNLLKAFNLKKHTDESKFLLRVLQFIAKCKNYNQIKNAFHHLATLFVTQFHGPEVDSSFQILNEMIKDQNEQSKNNCLTRGVEEKLNIYIDGVQVLDDKNEEEQIKILQQNGTMYGGSKFYHDFNKILQERLKAASISPTVRSNVKKNVFYNLTFLPTFAKNYMSIIPLWTGILITDPEIIFYHNQHVESFFNICKTGFRRKPILLGKLPTKCGRYLRENITRTRRDIKGFKWNIGKFRLATSYKPIRTNKKRKQDEKLSGSVCLARTKNKQRKRNKEATDYASLSEAKEMWMKKRPKSSKNRPVAKNLNEKKAEIWPSIDEFLNYDEEMGEEEEMEYESNVHELLPQSEIDFEKKLPNGLIEYVGYYKFIENFTYVVAINQGHRLSSEDFQYLSGTQWFSSMLIEYLLKLLLVGSKNVEGTCIRSNLLFTDPSQDLHKPFQKPFVLLPLHDVNHFVLFILDLNNRTISYIDSMGEKIEDFKRYMNNFRIFLAKYNGKFASIGDASQWRVKQYSHNIQTDHYNCGAYVTRFCHSFIQKGSIGYENFNPDQYRTVLQKMILEASDVKMEDHCLLCGISDHKTKANTDWIQCGVCERWLHSLACAEVDINDYTEDEPYQCRLCESFTSH